MGLNPLDVKPITVSIVGVAEVNEAVIERDKFFGKLIECGMVIAGKEVAPQEI
jgi:hypothetical protein